MTNFIFLFLTDLIDWHVQRLAFAKHGAGAGVDSVWEQRKLEARKMLENAAESPASSASNQDGGPSFFPKGHLACPENALLGNLPAYQNDGRKKTPPPTRPTFTHNFDFGNTQKK